MMTRRPRLALRGLAVLAVLAVLVWGSDRITLQGERTIYTVECEGGAWAGAHCAGKLVPGPRYAFRASRRRGEVLHWIRGSTEPSGRYTDCTVKDRDNWSCNAYVDGKPRLTYEIVDGRPTRGIGGLTTPFHDVPKWKWWALRMNVPGFTDAES
jgi:hypothetical protein